MKLLKKKDSPNLRKSPNRKIKASRTNYTKKCVANPGTGQDRLIENGSSPEHSEHLQAVEKASVIDSERVAKIKRAIENGEYKADTKRTAEKLLRLEDEIWREKDES